MEFINEVPADAYSDSVSMNSLHELQLHRWLGPVAPSSFSFPQVEVPFFGWLDLSHWPWVWSHANNQWIYLTASFVNFSWAWSEETGWAWLLKAERRSMLHTRP